MGKTSANLIEVPAGLVMNRQSQTDENQPQRYNEAENAPGAGGVSSNRNYDRHSSQKKAVAMAKWRLERAFTLLV
jgi:hypothetical protein